MTEHPLMAALSIVGVASIVIGIVVVSAKPELLTLRRYEGAWWRAALIVSLLAWVILLTLGFHLMLWWVPSDWGWVSHGDEGGWQPLRLTIATLLGLACGLVSLNGMLDWADRRGRERASKHSADGW